MTGCFGIGRAPVRVAQSYQITPQAAGFSDAPKIYGQGFVFDDDDIKAHSLEKLEELRNSSSLEASRVFPFLSGEDLNKNPHHQSKKFVIYLSDLETEEELKRYPTLHQMVFESVYPERMKLGPNPNNVPLKRRWWAYQAHRPKLYKLLRKQKDTLCLSRVSPHLSFCVAPTDAIFSDSIAVLATDKRQCFALVQSRPHEVWTRFFASSMKDDVRYTPSDCFETFPFPDDFESSHPLETVGQTYLDYRAELMVSRNEGMTKTYNRFHDRTQIDSDIARLRELHGEMDRAVLHAYGWHDLAERVEPIFLDESNEDDHTYQGRFFWPSDFRDEVLARLLALNAERAETEHEGGLTALDEDDEDQDDDGDDE